MVRALLTLPLRITVRGTRMALTTAEALAGRAVMSALQVAHVVRHDGAPSDGAEQRTASAGRSERGDDPGSQAPGVDPRSEGARFAAQEGVSASPRPRRPRTAEPPAAASAGGPAPIVSAPAPDEEPPAPIAPEPVHVSEEPVLVREEAESGAEDGAGASVTIDPPWEGYQQMAAREVITRLANASAAELAAVQLYESSNRSRQTVLDAVERQLKAANGRGQPDS